MNSAVNEDHKLSFRGIFEDRRVKLFTKNSVLEISDEVSFDSEFAGDVSLEYFAGGVLSSVILSLAKGLKREGIGFDDLEASSQIFLKNPLSFIGVKGYKETPEIAKIKIRVYIYISGDFELLKPQLFSMLENSFVYNTLKHLIEVEISKVD